MGAVAFDGSQPSRPVGYYSYSVAEGSWSWSDEVYGLHGYTPREIPATTEVLLSHKHPHDRVRAVEVMEARPQDGKPFECYHRNHGRRERGLVGLSLGPGIKDGCREV